MSSTYTSPYSQHYMRRIAENANSNASASLTSPHHPLSFNSYNSLASSSSNVIGPDYVHMDSRARLPLRLSRLNHSTTNSVNTNLTPSPLATTNTIDPFHEIKTSSSLFGPNSILNNSNRESYIQNILSPSTAYKPSNFMTSQQSNQLSNVSKSKYKQNTTGNDDLSERSISSSFATTSLGLPSVSEIELAPLKIARNSNRANSLVSNTSYTDRENLGFGTYQSGSISQIPNVAGTSSGANSVSSSTSLQRRRKVRNSSLRPQHHESPSSLPQVTSSYSTTQFKSSFPHTAGTSSSSSSSSITQQLQQQHIRNGMPFFSEEGLFSSATSIRGLKPGNPNWINQDNFFIIESASNRDHMYCILDGHGENGHHVSAHCRIYLPQYMKHNHYDSKKAFLQMQEDLLVYEHDTKCSGATCVLVRVYDSKIIISNCGDSRAVLGRTGSSNSFVLLSNDHKPDKPDERKRILACGGHLGSRQVLVNQPGKGPMNMPVGPCRVWYQFRGETLGLAMSRSLGDTVAHRVGVSHDPEVIEHDISENDEFIIIATDGVWDVLDNIHAVHIVNNCIAKAGQNSWNPLDASNAITRLARSKWEKMSPMIDDITCIVVKLKTSS